MCQGGLYKAQNLGARQFMLYAELLRGANSVYEIDPRISWLQKILIY